MKSQAISLSDVLLGNKRVCLSALRPLNCCFECPSYESCESRIRNFDYEQLVRKINIENDRHIKEIISLMQEKEAIGK